MPRTIGRFFVLWSAISFYAIDSYAQTPGADLPVAHALAAVELWLSDVSTGPSWRNYLRLEDLQAQVQLGAKADPAVVAAVLSRLESGARGLDLPRFARLRAAVAEWNASLTAPTLEKLPEVIRQAKQSYVPVDAAQLAAQRERVVAASGALKRYLGRSSSGEGWREYLKLAPLEAAIRSGASPPADVLRAVLAQLRMDEPGLDRSQFTSLAAAISDDLVVLHESETPDARAQFEARIDELATHIEQYVKEGQGENLKAVGSDLAWLSTRRQALPLVTAVNHRLSQPNLLASLSGGFLGAGLNRTVDETAPLRDVILGTSIVGSGRTRGDVTFRLLPDPDIASVEATLEGVNYSQNTGYNGPAVIRSIGTTRLVATKKLAIDINGIHAGAANVGAETSTRITSIGSSRGGVMGCMVERIASKRVSQQKPQAERIAGEHAEKRLDRQFEAQIGKELAQSNEQFLSRFRNPLVRRGALPDVRFSSSSERVFVTALQAHGSQLGAQSAPPEAIDKSDISLRLHQSMINNFTANTLAGQTVGQPELEKFAKDFLGEIPERLKDDPGRDPWTITFDDAEPVTFVVADGGFAFTGRGKKYTSGDRSFPAMNFTVKYKLEKQGQGVKATRLGDIEILPPNFDPTAGKPLSIRYTTLRQLMMRRLGKIFEPEIVKDQPMALKGRWQPAGPLELAGLSADTGWLNIGWRRIATANVAQSPAGARSTSPRARN